MNIRTFALLFSFVLLSAAAKAQYIEDALRLSQPPDAVSARAAGMGNAFSGVADDFSAIYFNPAGLALLRKADFSLGVMNANGKTESTFLGSGTTADDGNFRVNNLGLALPFPVDRGSLVFAFGYTQLIDYSGMQTYEGYNTQSSILPTLYTVPFNFKNNPDYNEDYDLTWQLGLEDTTEFVPIRNNILQNNETRISGSLGQWSFGGSAEIAKDMMLGVSFNVLTGSFKNERTFTETDINNNYSGVIAGKDRDRNDFRSAQITETVDQDLSGWNVKLGALYNYQNIFRGGITIQTPTVVTVDEVFSRDGRSVFEDYVEYAGYKNAPHIYDITSPWVFGFAASYAPLEYLRVSAEVEMRDYTETEFSNSNDDVFELYDVPELNRRMRNDLQSAASYRFGLEFQVPHTGVILRGGYGMNPSPYKDVVLTTPEDGQFYDMQTTDDVQTISGGIGYIVQDRFMLNAAYIMSMYDATRFIYHDAVAPTSSVTVAQKYTNSRLMFSISYLF